MERSRRPSGTGRSRSVTRQGIGTIQALFLIPAAVILLTFIALPLGRSVQLSLFDVNLLRPSGGTFVGLGNYGELLGDKDFWRSFRITVIYTVATVACAYVFGMVTALLLNRKFRFRWLARILIIIPWAIPEVVAVMIFKWIFDAQFGIVNHLLMQLHIIAKPIAFLSDPDYAFLIVIGVTTWLEYPLATLILLAGLQTIPTEVVESASIDGAGSIRRFMHITFPMLRFVNVVVFVLLTLDTFRRTTLIYTMTGGGPAGATMTLPVWTYVEAFGNYSLGYASTIGIAIMAILGVGTVFYLVRVNRGGDA